MPTAKKILIVDDEPNIVLSLEFLMRKQGFQVFIARNGLEAMDLLGKERVDLVILDIMMPEADGYEVCEFIKSRSELAHCKIVFLTAKSKESDIEKGYQAGADLYLTKPFSTRNLLKEVEALV